MSEGPIKQERRGHVAPAVSTTAKDRVCAEGRALNSALGKGYCGRSGAPKVADWSKVTCADCHAARRADEAVAS